MNAQALLAASLVTLLGCGPDGALELAQHATLDQGMETELAFPGAEGEQDSAVVPLPFGDEVLSVERFGEVQVFEGDMLVAHHGPPPVELPEAEHGPRDDAPGYLYLEDHELDVGDDLQVLDDQDDPGQDDLELDEALLAAVKDAARLWPNGVVRYRIKADVSDAEKVKSALRHWGNQTKLRFKPKGANTTNWVTFRRGTGCSAHVGRVGGEQFINLSADCSRGNIIHEIGHAVGLWHTQSRTDRGDHVRIRWANIQEGKESNFKTYSALGYSGRNIGPYRLKSIMHYGSTAFSRNGKPTIVKAGGGTFESQRTGLIARDISAVHKLYGL